MPSIDEACLRFARDLDDGVPGDPEARLARVVEELYAGSGDPRDWQDLLDGVCAYLEAETGEIVVGSRDPASRAAILRPHGSSAARRRMIAGEGRIWRGHGGESMDLDDGPLSGDPRDPCCQIGAVLVRDEDTVATLTVMRSSEAGPFTPEDARRFARLVPHFQRAYRLHKALRRATRIAAGATAFVDSLDNPVILCDGRGQVVLANEAARALAARGGLSLRGERLSLPRAADEGRLQACLAQAAGSRAPARDTGGRGALAITVPRPDPDPPLRFLVCPVPAGAAIEGGEGDLVALIGVAGEGCRPMAPLLASLFDLTAAEARLVDQLRQGLSLKEAADALGVAHSTTRTQLAAIFAKTQTSRQSELVGLVGRSLSLQAPL